MLAIAITLFVLFWVSDRLLTSQQLKLTKVELAVAYVLRMCACLIIASFLAFVLQL